MAMILFASTMRIMQCHGDSFGAGEEHNVHRTTESILHTKVRLLSMVSRPRKFTPSTEEPTCQKASCPSPILNLKCPHSQLANWEGLLCFFCLWSLGQATRFGFVNTPFCSYPVCPNQKVTVIFGFVPIAPPNVISHILLPISALNRQSLWWSQACFKIPWEPQCQAITTLELEMEKAVIRGWLAQSLWVIAETLSPDAVGLGCWGVRLSDEILTPWHLKTFHNMWDVGPSIWYPGYFKIWVVLFYFWFTCSF